MCCSSLSTFLQNNIQQARHGNMEFYLFWRFFIFYHFRFSFLGDLFLCFLSSFLLRIVYSILFYFCVMVWNSFEKLNRIDLWFHGWPSAVSTSIVVFEPFPYDLRKVAQPGQLPVLIVICSCTISWPSTELYCLGVHMVKLCFHGRWFWSFWIVLPAVQCMDFISI